jgi:hypothetical protein
LRKGVVKRGLFAVALAAAVLVVPAASAAHAPRVKLAVVSLPKSALGAAGRSLALSRDSGVVNNAGASSNSVAAAANTFDKLGRITGYVLTYGDRYSGGSGVTEISTAVDEYKTSAGAKRGLAFWRTDDAKITVLESYGLDVAVTPVKAAKVGTRRFAEGITFTVPNAAPLAYVDEQFTEGRYVLQAKVAAASLSAATAVAGKLARTLDHRLRLAEAGHLRSKPVKLPPNLKAGPPRGGPDLSTLVLRTSDFAGQATVLDEGYGTPNGLSLSEYERDMQPAGNFAALSQTIDWFPHANNATVMSRAEGAALAYVFAAGFLTGTPGQFTPVDLSAVGDNAYGGIVSLPRTGQPTAYLAVVALSSGRADDVVLASSQSQIQAADIVNLAQATAKRLDAGLAG